MGGLLHLFDFHQGHIRRKHKKKGDVAVDAPRNSLDLPAETCQSHYANGDGKQVVILYSSLRKMHSQVMDSSIVLVYLEEDFQAKDLAKRSYYPTIASTNNFINDEILKRSSNKQNAPSIVAKLMGMDESPVDTPEDQSLKDISDKREFKDRKIQHIEKVSALSSSNKSKPPSKKEHHSYKDAYLHPWSSGKNSEKPHPRVHPQEKELQKFKKEFEAWQAARFLECARVVELGNIPEQWLAQLHLTKEKMALYETSRKEVIKKSMEHNVDMAKSRSVHIGDSQYLPYKKETLPAEHKESSSYSSRGSSRDFEQLSLKDSDQNSNKSSAPSRIVVLKPGPDSFCTTDESWVSSSCSVEDRDCIEDLLEEVKQRLKFEMQGKTFRNGFMVRGGGIETPFKEKPAFTKQASQPLVKRTKANITRDLRRKLLRSESVRSYQSEFQVHELAPSFPELMNKDERTFLGRKLLRSESARLYQTQFHVNQLAPSSPESMGKEERKLHRSESARFYQTEFDFNELAPSSPELMSRATGKFVSERLRNALNGENRQNLVSDGFSRMPWCDDARERLEKARDILNAAAGRNYWRDKNYEVASPASPARPFKHEIADNGNFLEQASPRNLVRSLSAPVSGTSFGKLLLEDRYISTGAHIKRKHEVPEKLSTNAKGQRKDSFNFREKVSTIKYSLSLRKRLLSRKFQSMDLSQSNEFDSAQYMMNGPTIITFRDRIDNSTEVPPSPASVCSTPHEDLWKTTDCPSPISNSDVTSVGDHSVGNVFREISSNLTELRKQLNQLEYEPSEITSVTEEQLEQEEEDCEDEAEAYIKHLLITSGLYDGACDKSCSRYDPYMKPLSNWVFEKVEESYRKPPTDIEEVANDNNERGSDRKLFFDLLNEALTVVLGPPRSLSKFRRKLIDTAPLPHPQGRKLLDRVWQMISEYSNPAVDSDTYSLDDIVAHDLNIMPWGNLIDEEITSMGKELECQITGELVQELVMEMQLSQCTDANSFNS
ncbi:hypothetical protein Cgig2_001634 [Carnegiea gigantea]|uniref:DUF4378 domain-containing protein n=1 Tax=Carnegiea gigantea TaxID=171969 RepID=A0A9Q1H0D7_9CARY|nr:hypothetical protein Cgig2_001634 [Carnegiea gigantea]